MGRLANVFSRRRLYATDRARDFDHEHDRSVRTKQIYESIDRQGYQWVVVLVAGIGFFLDGYTLFVSNIALPMISYVYWRDATTSMAATHINIATLGGTALGQLAFGFLADKYGRQKMYGFELVVVILATFGVVMSSEGADRSMSVYGWLIWWRIVVGIGVGADYPLSAVITSEFAPTAQRARMMASVFFMQPLGQVCGNLVSIFAVLGFRNSDPTDLTRSVDRMWRIVIGIGVVPGVVALFFRIAIPETPRFISEIEEDPIKAEFDATQLFGELPRDLDGEVDLEQVPRSNSHPLLSLTPADAPYDAYETTHRPSMATAGASKAGSRNDSLNSLRTGSLVAGENYTIPNLNASWKRSRADIHKFFWVEGNWRSLFATSAAWLLLDFGFYGISLSNPQFLAKAWGTLNIVGPQPLWLIDSDPNTSVYDMFMNTSTHALVILNVGSFCGGLLLILFANRVNRVSLQKWGFILLAAIFIGLGVALICTKRTGAYTVVLYVIAGVAFNFGPNGTTYILPGEIFPTRYRATCHGISAAFGKLGSVFVQIFAAYYNFGAGTLGEAQTSRYGTVLIVLSAAMLLGALVTHLWIPEVQDADTGKSKTLEQLARGRMGQRSRTLSTLREKIGGGLRARRT